MIPRRTPDLPHFGCYKYNNELDVLVHALYTYYVQFNFECRTEFLINSKNVLGYVRHVYYNVSIATMVHGNFLRLLFSFITNLKFCLIRQLALFKY